MGFICLLLLAAQAGFAADLSTAKGAIAVDAYNNLAATAERSGLVRIFDVTAPDRPVLLSKITVPRELSGIALAGDSLLVAGQSGVQILDISNPKAPQFRSSVELGAETVAVKAAGNLGYAAVGNSVVVFNVASGEILDRRSYSALEVNDLALSEDSLYVLSADQDSLSGFELVKVGVGSRLGLPIASWKSPGAEHSGSGRLWLWAAEGVVYVGGVPAGDSPQVAGLAMLQDQGVSFRAAGVPEPVHAGAVRPIGAGLLGFAGSGADGESADRIGILDISDQSPTGKLVKTIATAGPAFDLTFNGEYAYVAAGGAGLQTVRIAVPSGAAKPPAVELASGAVSEAPLASTLIRLTASATATDAIRKVEFFVNGRIAATDGNYPYEYRFAETDAAASASMTVSACAEDIDGNRTCTPPRELDPKSGSGMKIISVSPTAGSHTPRDGKFAISAKFSTALDAATVATKNVTLTSLGKGSSAETAVALAGVSYDPATRSILLHPKAPLVSGSYRATISAAIRGAGGSTLAAGYQWIFELTPATITWTSPISGKWETAANWSGGLVPANGDNVVISKSPGITVTLSTLNPILENLTVGGGNTLTLAGGNLSVVGTGSIATLNLGGGSIGGPGQVTVATAMTWTSGVVSGVLNIPAKGTLKLATPFNPNGSFQIAGGTLNNGGTVTQSFAGTPGAYTGFQMTQGGVINNLAGGVWNVANDVWFYPADGSAVAFNNYGTFNKTGGTNTSIWSVPFAGTGPISVQIGDLRLNGGFTGTLKSAIGIAAKATLDYAQGGTIDGAKVTGSGTMNFDAATTVAGIYSFTGLTQIQSGSGAVSFQGATTMATLNLISGSLAGPGPVTVTGTTNWTGGGISGVLDIPAKAALKVTTPFNPNGSFNITGGTLNNSGTVTESFAGTPGAYTGFQIGQGGTINNLAGGVWNVATDVWIYPADASAVAFNNAGTFNKAGGTNTTLWSVPLSGAGPINIESGDFKLNGHFTGALKSVVAISAKATLDYAQGGSIDGGSITGAGTMNFDAGTTVAGAYSFTGLTQIQSGTGAISFQGATTVATLNLISGALAGPGPVTVTGNTNWTGGGITGVLDIPAKATLKVTTPFNPNGSFYIAGGTLNNSGTVTQSFAGTPGAYTGFQMSQGGVINNLAGAVWNIATDVWLYSADASAVAFNNLGAFNKAGGANTSIWSIPLTGSGPVNIESGDLKLNGGFTGALTSVIAISAKATLDYAQGGALDGGMITGAGTMNFDTSTTVTGKYSFAGLTQIQSGSGAISFQGATTIATLNLISGALAGPGPVTVTGVTNWTGGGLTGELDIPTGATLKMTTPFNPDGTFSMAGGTLKNSGTVTQSFAGVPGQYTGMQVSLGASINNLAGGVWNAVTDVWIYPVDSSAVAFNNAGTFNKTGGTGTSLWTVPFGGAGPMNIESGDFKLNGAFTGDLKSAIAISAKAAVDYAQGGTLDGAKVTGSGTMNFDTATNVAGTYSFAGLTQIQSGTAAINFQGATTIATLNLTSGALAGAGPVTVTGAMDWTGGGITGVLDIPVSGTLKISTPFNPDGSFYIAGGTINNSGTVTQSFAGTPGAYTGMQISAGGKINNLAGGNWNVVSDVWIYPVGAGDPAANVFSNSGTFTKSGGINPSIWAVSFTNAAAGVLNVNSGAMSLSGTYKSSQISGVINIAAAAVLNYAQQGTLTNGKALGTGKFNLSTPSDGTNSVTGTYTITVPASVTGSALDVKFGATLNADTLSFTDGTFDVEGSTSIGKLEVSASSSSSGGSTVEGAGDITVMDTLNWGGGTLNVTGVIDTQNLDLAENSSISYQLGSSALSVDAELSLDGTLTLTPSSKNPTVGTIFKVLNFDNGFLGKFLDDLLDIPLPGTNDYLKESLTDTGLEFAVTPNPPPDSIAQQGPAGAALALGGLRPAPRTSAARLR
jgi:hypothetical protein